MNPKWLLDGAEDFEPRGTVLSVGRSLLAFAQLTVLLASPDRVLFSSTPAASPAQLCSGTNSFTLWCVTGVGVQTHGLGGAVASAILIAVVAGYHPRRLCIPHWYVTFSLAARMTAGNGGENAAEIFSLLLIPLCLGDTRAWHWQRPDRPVDPVWRGAAFAAHLLLRCQILVVYLEAALSKVEYPAWRHGTALRTLLYDPHYGLPPALQPIADAAFAVPGTARAATWGVVTTEIFIALSMLFGLRTRRAGLVAAVCLHCAIIVAMGLVSFGLIMIALLATASGGSFQSGPRIDPRAADPADAGLHPADPTASAIEKTASP